MKLAEVQRDFHLWLAGAVDSAARRLAGDNRAGLAVYQNNYRAQLIGCLEASYPLLRTRMGPDAFLHVAVTHVSGHPPHAWTLDAYAEGFEDTLQARFPDNPDLHELCWIELALGSAFIAADAAAVDTAALAAADWDRVILGTAPSLQMRTSTTNAADVWRALSAGTEVPEGAMREHEGSLVVWRSRYTSCLRAADALEGEALALLQRDGSFAALCDLLAGRLGDEAGIARAGALLADWIGAGLITDWREGD